MQGGGRVGGGIVEGQYIVQPGTEQRIYFADFPYLHYSIGQRLLTLRT